MIRPTGTPSGLNVLREDLPLPLCVLRGAAVERNLARFQRFSESTCRAAMARYSGAADSARMVPCATRPGSRSDLEGCCGEADRVVVVRPSSPVSDLPGRERCRASVGSAGADGAGR
jgi:hypothetical protein